MDSVVTLLQWSEDETAVVRPDGTVARPWHVYERAGDRLTLHFVSGPRVAVAAVDIDESEDAVRIAVIQSHRTGKLSRVHGIAHATLAAPVAGRRVIDATTGHPRPDLAACGTAEAFVRFLASAIIEGEYDAALAGGALSRLADPRFASESVGPLVSAFSDALEGPRGNRRMSEAQAVEAARRTLAVRG
jgi:hypothetical protein